MKDAHQKLLNEFLSEWFAEIEDSGRFWSRDSTAKIIKTNLMQLKRWKGKRRGNPLAGKKASDEAKKKKREAAKKSR